MIICICNNVSDQEIRGAVDLGVSTMAELRRDLRVAADCGACADFAYRVMTDHLESKWQLVARPRSRPGPEPSGLS